MSFTAEDGYTYRIADAHTHIYTDKIAAKAANAIGAYYETDMAVKDPVSSVLLQEGARIGVERYLVCSAATTLHQVDSINHFIAQECQSHPEFVGLGTAHQDVTDPDALMDQIVDLGLHGIKLHPDFQKFNIDDPAMMPLYQSATEHGLVILFHVGDDRVDYSSPERLARVLDKIPDMKCHAAHFGCCRLWKKRPLALAGADIMYDTSSMTKWASADEVRSLIDEIGIEHLMFGTDFPMWDHRKELDRIFALGLTHQEYTQLFYDNFARFYELDK
jgi:predicted TIM-barrel fold metal-dependent hydrolase